QFARLDRLGEEVVGAEAKALDLVVELAEAGEDQDRRAHPRGAQSPQYLVPVHVGQQDTENDDVVILEFVDLQPVFAEIRRVADKAFLLQHQLDACRSRGIILNQQNAHRETLPGEPAGGGRIVILNDYYHRRLINDYRLG